MLPGMITTLTVVGGRLALVLDPTLLEQLRIDADTPLEVETDGQTLVLRPQRVEARRARLEAAVRKMMDAHDATLKELAK